MLNRAGFAACALAIVLLAGCGGGDDATDAERVRAAIDTWRDARVASDGKRYCAVQTRSARLEALNSEPGAKSCADALRIDQHDEPDQLHEERSLLRSARIVDVRVAGGKATGALEYRRGRLEFRLEKVSARWLIAGAGVPPERAS